MGIIKPKSVLDKDSSFQDCSSFTDGREEEIQVEDQHSSRLNTSANSLLERSRAVLSMF